MKIEEFSLERTLARFQNEVEYDLSASGIYPMFIRELITPDEMENMYKNLQLKYVHTAGTENLRTAVSTFYNGMSPENVFICNGSAEALFLMAWSMLEPGDEIAFMIPNFMLINNVAESNGVIVRHFYLDPKNNWAMDVESLKAAVNEKTKIICICNPNNPTGTVLKKNEMLQIVEAARKVGAYLFSDEVYRGAEQDGVETESFWGLYEKAIIISGLSKSFGLPGLRIGWIAAPSDLIEKYWFYHDFLSTTATTVSDYLGSVALMPEMRAKIFARNREIIRQNLSQFTRWIESYNGVLEFTPPQAGCYAFVKYDFDVPSWDLVMDMVESNSVFVIPGHCFGIENHLRINFGIDPQKLREGLKRIDLTFAKYKKE